MEYSVTAPDHTTSIKLKGQFTFTDAQKFKDILDLLDKSEIKEMSLDFSEITFIDSACMGMLLLLRDECQSRDIFLNIHSINGQVEKIFSISKFDQIFAVVRGD